MCVELSIIEEYADMLIQPFMPQPSKAYVKALEAELLRTREALRQALEDMKYVEENAKTQHLVTNFFYKKDTSYKSPKKNTFSPLRTNFDSNFDSSIEILANGL